MLCEQSVVTFQVLTARTRPSSPAAWELEAHSVMDRFGLASCAFGWKEYVRGVGHSL